MYIDINVYICVYMCVCMNKPHTTPECWKWCPCESIWYTP